MSKKQEKKYAALLADICAMYESTLIMGIEAQRKNKVETFWKMGCRMAAAEQGDEGMSTYGMRVVARLSKDLTQKYGGGFKKRNVYYIRDFATSYGAGEFTAELSWQHYKALLGVADTALRAKYETLALEKNIGAQKLEYMIKVGSLTDVVPPNLEQLLAPRKAQIGLGKMVVEEEATRRVFVDLGFYSQVPVRNEDAEGLEHGMMVSVKKKVGSGRERVAPVSLVHVKGKAGERYCYEGTLLDVVDGDTVRVRLHLGLQVYHVERLRLRSVAAPEIVTAQGQSAAALARELVAVYAPVRVLTYGRDRYGRWVGDVYFGDAFSRFLNQELIEMGAAKYVDMRA